MPRPNPSRSAPNPTQRFGRCRLGLPTGGLCLARDVFPDHEAVSDGEADSDEDADSDDGKAQSDGYADFDAIIDAVGASRLRHLVWREGGDEESMSGLWLHFAWSLLLPKGIQVQVHQDA